MSDIPEQLQDQIDAISRQICTLKAKRARLVAKLDLAVSTINLKSVTDYICRLPDDVAQYVVDVGMNEVKLVPDSINERWRLEKFFEEDGATRGDRVYWYEDLKIGVYIAEFQEG